MKYLKTPMSLLREADNFEKSYFRVPKFAMIILNQWPCYKTMPRKSSAIMIFNLVSLSLVIFGCLNYCIEVMTQDLGLALRALCPCITMATTFIKLVYLAIYRKDFGLLITNLKQHLKWDNKSHEKTKIITSFSRISLKYTLTLFIFGFMPSIFFSVSPIVNYFVAHYEVATWNEVNSTKTVVLELPFPISLPYIDWDSVRHTVFYKVVYIISVLCGNTTIFGFFALDGGFICFCLYLSAAQKAVQHDFEQEFKEYEKDEVLTTKQNDVLYSALAKHLHRHANIRAMSKELSRLYAPIILIHFLFAALSIGISSILLTALAQGFEKTIYFAYDIGASIQVFVYCSGAEYLNENTLIFADLCYACPWYKCNKRVRKLVLLTMIGAQCGCHVDVPFFQPSLQVFQAIIRTAGSYITLLQTFL